MKNLLVLVMVLALVGSVSADASNYGPGSPWGIAGNGLNPYGFDTDGNLTDAFEGTGQNPDLWGTWGGDASSNGSVVCSGGLCTITTNSYELAFSHDNALLDLPGLPVAAVDDLEIILTVESVTGDGYVSMKLEYYDWDVFPNNDNGGDSIRIDDFEANGDLITAPGVYSFKCSDLGIGPIPAGTLAVTPVITVAGGATVAVIDEIWIGKEGSFSLTKATNPSPGYGAVVGSNLTTTLSWTNPETNDPGDAITCDVYFLDAGLTQLTQDPNMGPTVTDAGVVQIANDLEAETLDLNDALVPVLPLDDDHYYYWAVHCTDPNQGGAVTTQGDVWYFLTGDAVPVVNAGTDEYAWVAKEDGDGNPLEYTITVTGTYADDGKSPIVDANFVNLGWDIANGEAGIEKVSQTWDQAPGTIHTSGTVTAVFKTVDGVTEIPGYWDLQLQITDGAGTGQDTVFVRVDPDCGTATANDPSDTWDGYYDTNNDCVVDLSDFIDFAEKWLDQSVKYE